MLNICTFSCTYIAKSGRQSFLISYFFLQRLVCLFLNSKGFMRLIGHVLIKNECTYSVLLNNVRGILIFFQKLVCLFLNSKGFMCLIGHVLIKNGCTYTVLQLYYYNQILLVQLKWEIDVHIVGYFHSRDYFKKVIPPK